MTTGEVNYRDRRSDDDGSWGMQMLRHSADARDLTGIESSPRSRSLNRVLGMNDMLVLDSGVYQRNDGSHVT